MGKQLPYKKKHCEDCICNDLVPDAGGRDKWFCFGITDAERRKLKNIPDSDSFRFCVHGNFEPVKKYFQLNINEEEVRKIVECFEKLLKARKRTMFQRNSLAEQKPFSINLQNQKKQKVE